jgi:hypothetical protein
LTPDDYVELLPAKWQAITASGVRIGRRTYDGDVLDLLRGQPSGVTAKNNRWEIHYDPYDVSRVWVRNHPESGWIMLFWKHLRHAPIPFGELAWDHVRRGLPDGTEEELAAATQNLLTRAHAGAATIRDRRVQAKPTSPVRPQPPRPAIHRAHRPSPIPSTSPSNQRGNRSSRWRSSIPSPKP